MSKADSILTIVLLLGSLLLLAPLVHAAQTAQPENSCVNCHFALKDDSLIKVKSHGWKGSIHQQYNVTCDRCHGGDPQAASQEAAHSGVLPSNDPKSPIYFKNIPATCGKCHGAVYYKFSQSLHYQKLEATGQGPECVTCHGSMQTRILAPDDLMGVCQRCHNERIGIFPDVPQKARAVLLLIRESQMLLAAEKELRHPGQESETAKNLSAAGTALHTAKLNWHTFELDGITSQLQDFYQTLEKLPRK